MESLGRILKALKEGDGRPAAEESRLDISEARVSKKVRTACWRAPRAEAAAAESQGTGGFGMQRIKHIYAAPNSLCDDKCLEGLETILNWSGESRYMTMKKNCVLVETTECYSTCTLQFSFWVTGSLKRDFQVDTKDMLLLYCHLLPRRSRRVPSPSRTYRVTLVVGRDRDGKVS